MGTKLTFKEYLASKDKLREAITNVPKQTAEYTVKKYCKLVVGESKEDKQYISLKPNHRIIVEWQYDHPKNPTILGIMFEGVEDVDGNEEHDCYWGGERFQKWLTRNTKKDI